MGGYDYCLFKITDKFPSNPREFWMECKKRMFRKFGGDINSFNSIWYSEDSSFNIFWDEDNEELWGKLDW